METIILTVKPVHLGNIRSGVKTEEIRKTVPKGKLPVRVLCCESGEQGSAAGGGRSDRSEVQRSADAKEHRRRRQMPGTAKGEATIPPARLAPCHLPCVKGGLFRAPQSWCYVSEGALPVAGGATERSAAVDKIEDQQKPEDFIGHRKRGRQRDEGR